MALAIDGKSHLNNPHGSTFTPTMTLTTTQANDIIVFTCMNTNNIVVTDVVGSTIGEFFKYVNSGNTVDAVAEMDLWVCFAAAPLTGEVVTITMNQNYSLRADLFGVSGSNQTDPDLVDAFEEVIANELGAFSGAMPQNYTTVHANTMVLGLVQNWNTAADTPGSGWTLINSGDNLITEYRVLSAPATVSISVGVDVYCSAMIGIAIIQATAGPTAYVMPAGTGTLTLSGQAAALQYVPFIPVVSPRLISRGRLLRRPWLRKLAVRPVVPPVVVTNYVMPADVGTLTLSGQTAALQSVRMLAAGLGTLTLAGQNAGVVYSGAGSKTMPAGLGTLTLGGQAVALRVTRALPAGLGTLALAGQIVALRSARKVVAGLGTLTLSGQALLLRPARKVVAGLGTLTLSGQVVALPKTGTATHGAWDSNTANNATLSNGDRTAAGSLMFVRSTDSHANSDSGKYYAEVKLDSTVAGFVVNVGLTDVFFNQTYVDSNGSLSDNTGFLGTFPSMVFAAGAVVGIAYDPSIGKAWIRINNGIWNGSGTANPATNTGGIGFTPEGQAFAFASNSTSSVTTTINTGTAAFVNAPPAGFVRWYGPVTMPAVNGTLTLGGQSVTLRYVRRPVAGLGTLTLSGQVVGLRYSRSSLAELGTLTLGGQTVTLRYAHKLVAVNGTLVLDGRAAGVLWSATGSRLMPAGFGTLTLSGRDAELRRVRSLAAGLGTLTLSGRTANVTVSTTWTNVGTGPTNNATSASLALTMPSGTAEGDLLVAVISYRIASTVSMTLPTGGEWNLVTEQKNNNILTGTSAVASGMMAYCVRGASDPVTTFTFPVAPSVGLGQIVAWRGVDPLAPLNVSGSFTTAVNTSAVSAPGVTTTVSKAMVVVGLCGGQAVLDWTPINATNPGIGSTGVSSLPPGINTWRDRTGATPDATGADTSLDIADGLRDTAGATGNITANASSTPAAHVVLIGAFKPVPVAIKSVTALTGTLVLGGQPVALRYARVPMVAGTGTLVLGGQTAVLRYTRKPTAGLGTLTLAGQVTALRSGRRVIAGQGTLTLAGQVATPKRNYTISAGLGTLALAGQIITFKRKYVMPAGQSTLTLGGQPVILRWSASTARILAAGTGALTLMGQTEVNRAARTLIAGKNVGSAPPLDTTPVVLGVIAGTGGLVLAGQAAALRSSAKIIPAALSTLTLAGQAVALTRSGGASVFLLDSITPQPTVAVSTRKLRAAYAGNCMQLVSTPASGAVIGNIGFVSNEIDQAAADTHYAIGNESVVNYWYDQSGNGNNLEAYTASPAVMRSLNYNVGVQPRVNGFAGVNFNNDVNRTVLFMSTKHLADIITASTFTVIVSGYWETSSTSTPSAEVAAALSDGANGWLSAGAFYDRSSGMLGNNRFHVNVYDGSDKSAFLPATPATKYIGVAQLGSGALKAWLNGGTAASVTSGNIQNISAGNVVVSPATGGGGNFIMLELLIYSTALSAADINTLCNGSGITKGSLASRAGITWTTLS